MTPQSGLISILQFYFYRSAEGNLHTKVVELQEDISIKRYDLGVAQLQLAAIHAQVGYILYQALYITKYPYALVDKVIF